MAFRLIYVAAAVIGGIIETSPVPPSVVLDGARDALFLYDAAGHLVSSLAPTSGTDSFGNAYSAIFNAGIQTGAHFGVDANGTCYFVNAANQNVIMINPGKQAMFAYSGAPAAANLTTAIAAAAGTDTVGNQYPEGVTSFNNTLVTFANLEGAVLRFGPVVAGVPDTTDASYVYGAANGEIVLNSGTQAAPTNDPAEIVLIAGQQNQATGSLAAPQMFIGDLKLNSAVDCYISGTHIKTNNSGTPETWQTPAYNTNWAASTTFNGSANWGSVQFRKEPIDELWIGGAFKAGATLPGAAVFMLPAGYRPKAQWPLAALHNHGGTVTPCFLAVTTGGNVDVITQTGGAIAINDEFLIAPTHFPLGNIA